MIETDFLLYFAAGAFTGLLSGLLGVGGGTVIVPILVSIFTAQHFPEACIMHMALGTSLATIIFTSISSARAHQKKGNVDWKVVRRITFGILIGTLLGALLASKLHSSWLKAIFSVFALCIATQMIMNFTPDAHRQVPGSTGLSIVGGFIGVVSSLVGIGGGTVTVPFLIYCSFNPRLAIGSSAAIGIPIAIAGTIGYIYAGFSIPNLPEHSFGFIYLPAFIGITITSILTAPLGAALAQKLATHTLKRLFAILLFIVGFKMLWSL
jgi:uncharacterized membrane protein YfcA